LLVENNIFECFGYITSNDRVLYILFLLSGVSNIFMNEFLGLGLLSVFAGPLNEFFN